MYDIASFATISHGTKVLNLQKIMQRFKQFYKIFTQLIKYHASNKMLQSNLYAENYTYKLLRYQFPEHKCIQKQLKTHATIERKIYIYRIPKGGWLTYSKLFQPLQILFLRQSINIVKLKENKWNFKSFDGDACVIWRKKHEIYLEIFVLRLASENDTVQKDGGWTERITGVELEVSHNDVAKHKRDITVNSLNFLVI